MTSTAVNNTLFNDTNSTDEIAIDIDSMSTESAQMHMYTTSPLTNTDTIFLESVNTLAQLSCALHHPRNEMSQRGGHGQANPETVKDQHTSFIAEITRNQNKMPDMSKVLLQMVGASIASFLPLAYQSPSTSTGGSLGLLSKVVSINLCITTIVLLIGIVLRELKPRLAKVIEKLGVLLFTCSILLLMLLLIA